MKYILTVFLFISTTTITFAQGTPNVQLINMSEMLPYIMPFYVITLISMGLFMHKLMRPNFPTRWLYLTTIIGILGAAIIMFKFEDFKKDKLALPDEKKIRIDENPERDLKENKNEMVGDFWRIAIPNIILLQLGANVDYRNKKAAEENN
jgi:hypothetical protein